MAAKSFTTLTEEYIREKLQLNHHSLGDLRSLTFPGTYENKIRHLGNALINFVRLSSLDLSYNALVSVEGIQHLRLLETLVLYYNCIPSLEAVKELYQLPALRELDLRLNPLTKTHPNYQLHLVHAMPHLRKLDGCSVKDTERKVAIMQFSSDLLPQPMSPSVCQAAEQRSSDHRLASVDRLTKRLSLLTSTDDIVLNDVATNQIEPQALSDSVHKEGKDPNGDESKGGTEQNSSTPNQETTRSILKYPPKDPVRRESRVSHLKTPSNKRSSASLKVTDKPKVTFEHYVEKNKPVPGKQEQKDLPKQNRQAAKGYFTPNPDQSQGHSSSFSRIRPPSPRRPGLNLSDPSNPILHPPRLTYSCSNKTKSCSSPPEQKTKKGSYRKPLEMLLNLLDQHWTEDGSLHQSDFLSQVVHILTMMENYICSQEAEARILKKETDALNFQLAARDEEHKSEMCSISAQLEEARSTAVKLNEQMRAVLEENVSLQRQLIRLKQQHLRSTRESSPHTEMEEIQTEVVQLRRDIEEFRQQLQFEKSD